MHCFIDFYSYTILNPKQERPLNSARKDAILAVSRIQIQLLFQKCYLQEIQKIIMSNFCTYDKTPCGYKIKPRVVIRSQSLNSNFLHNV